MFPIEKHEFLAGRRAVQKGSPAVCISGRADGLHIKCGPALFCSPPVRPVVQPVGRREFIFCMEIPPSGSSALRLVLSGRNSVGINFTAQLTVGGRLCVALEQESTTFTKVFADAFHIKSFHQIFVQSPLPRLAEAACLFSLWQQLL